MAAKICVLMQVHVFKKKKRKRYRKYQGPRPGLTTLRVLQVRPRMLPCPAMCACCPAAAVFLHRLQLLCSVKGF
jgi:hypothetical protein